MAEKFFEWNKIDITQFDGSLITGPAVTGSSFAFVPDDGGVPFIEISVTAGAHSNGAESQAVLLVTDTPPGNLVFVADVHSVAAIGVNVGGGVVARYTAVNAGYVVRINNADGSGGGTQLLNKLAGTVGSPTVAPNLMVQSDPEFTAGTKRGTRVGIGVEGQSWLRMAIGEEGLVPDLSSPHTSGKVGLFATCSGLSGTNTLRFRNICGYVL